MKRPWRTSVIANRSISFLDTCKRADEIETGGFYMSLEEYSFTATGPTGTGFLTHGTNIDVGADIAGNNLGIRGQCVDGIGVLAISTNGIGLRGESTTGTGVEGESKQETGVHGTSHDQAGVHGSSTKGSGVYGVSSSGAGVWGWSGENRGGVFQSEKSAQVHLLPAPLRTSLPPQAKAGDLFVRLIEVEVMVDEKTHLREPRAELWFCVQPTDAQPDAPVLWSKVRLESPVSPT
jgi:hypothetical protein